MIRKIIHIDEEKCNGCGICANACHEGAIDIIDGKAKLVREHFCDGLGDCLPACPTGARVSFRTNGREDIDEEIVLEQCQGIAAITALNRRLAGIDLAKDSADFARMIRQIIPNCRQSRQYVCITTRPVRDILEAVTLLQRKAAEVLLIVAQIAGE